VSACTLLLFALLGAAPADDVVTLANGDRITGRILSKGKKTLRLSTPHGLLTIPLEKIERMRRADGTEEVLNAPPPPPPPPPTPAPPKTLKLTLEVRGKTFWQAWDAEEPPEDPALRLQLHVDEAEVAAWVDAKVDPGEIKKAVVNSFSFTPESLRVMPAPAVKGLPPALEVGRIELALEVPAGLEGERTMRVAYQANAGTSTEPRWQDLVSAETQAVLQAGADNTLRLEQDRGQMEFSKRRMKNVESFALSLKLDTPADEP
jgi:hypothetical protein